MQQFLAENIQWVKALHVIAIVAWMAGMMYLPRLFVYHFQSEAGGEAESYFIAMERRLLKGIINPSMIATWIFGGFMVYAQPHILQSGWFILKIVCVLGISGIHGFYSSSVKKFAVGEKPKTEKFWRIMNEVPFILMIIAVIMVLVKPF